MAFELFATATFGHGHGGYVPYVPRYYAPVIPRYYAPMYQPYFPRGNSLFVEATFNQPEGNYYRNGLPPGASGNAYQSQVAGTGNPPPDPMQQEAQRHLNLYHAFMDEAVRAEKTGYAPYPNMSPEVYRNMMLDGARGELEFFRDRDGVVHADGMESKDPFDVMKHTSGNALNIEWKQGRNNLGYEPALPKNNRLDPAQLAQYEANYVGYMSADTRQHFGVQLQQPGAPANGQGQNPGTPAAPSQPTQAGQAALATLNDMRNQIAQAPDGSITSVDPIKAVFTAEKMQQMQQELQQASPAEREQWLKQMSATLDLGLTKLSPELQQTSKPGIEAIKQQIASGIANYENGSAQGQGTAQGQNQGQDAANAGARITALQSMAKDDNVAGIIDKSKFQSEDDYNKAVDTFQGLVKQENDLMHADFFSGLFTRIMNFITHLGHPELASPEAYLQSLKDKGDLTEQGSKDLDAVRNQQFSAVTADAKSSDAASKDAGDKSAGADGGDDDKKKGDDAPDPKAIQARLQQDFQQNKIDTSKLTATPLKTNDPKQVAAWQTQLAGLGFDNLVDAKGHVMATGKVGDRTKADITAVEKILGLSPSDGLPDAQFAAAMDMVSKDPALQDALKKNVQALQDANTDSPPPPTAGAGKKPQPAPTGPTH